MKFHIPPFVSFLAAGAALTFAAGGCASSGERPASPAAPPRQVSAPPQKKTKTKTAAPVRAPAPAPAPVDELAAVRLAAREWWNAVLRGDRKRADLYVIAPEDNEFMIRYVRELKKNASSDVELRNELERMQRAVFGAATEQDGFIIVPMIVDGRTMVNLFFKKHNGKRLIFTIN